MRLDRYTRNPGRGFTDPRVLHLKLRVVTTVPMSAETARLLLHRAVETGRVPAGIEIHWIDWSKGPGSGVRGGTGDEGRVLTADIHAALQRFYGALTQGETRFERVK